MDIRKIAVIGAGIMGSGIVQAAAQSGYTVIIEDMKEEYAQAGLGKIRDRLVRRAEEGKMTPQERDSVLSRIRPVWRIEDCCEADMIIEAATESEEVKVGLFRELDAVCPERTIFATNTSSISITRIGRATKRPDRFVGMHFMNPAYVMKLVEIVRGIASSDETMRAVQAVSEAMGKTWVVVEDSPGFVSNRVLMPSINEAIYCLQDGVASREGIDTIMRLGTNQPMGPLQIADFIGLDTCLEILGVLHAELGDKFRPCPLLGKMVATGKLGRKSGEGFYEYR